MKRTVLIGVLVLALAAAGFSLIGCASPPPVFGGEAIDAVGISQVEAIQFYAGATFELILMHTKNDQPAAQAEVKRGVPKYTREKIVIPYNTPCVLVKHDATEDGKLILTVAFEKDESLLLSFMQSSNELGYYTSFDLMFEGASDTPVVKYGDAFYTVRSYHVVHGADGIKTGEAGARPFLGIKEKVKDKVIRSIKGRKI